MTLLIIKDQFSIVQNLHVSYSPNQFLGWDFFAASYSKTALGSQMALALYYETLKIEEYVMLYKK